MRPSCYAAAVGAALALAPAVHAQSASLILRPPAAVSPDFSRFGSTIAAADIDGNGTTELLVAAPGVLGAAFLYAADGALLRTFASPDPVHDGRFAHSLAFADDHDGDGVRDLVVGAPNESSVPTPPPTLFEDGRAFLFSGATGDTLRSFASPNSEQYGTFGHAVAAPGDLTNDGVPDVVVGAPGEDIDGVFSVGRVYVFSGADGALVRTLLSPTPSDGGLFGYRLTLAGDLTGDGLTDLLVSAPREPKPSNPFSLAGRVHLFDGATGAFVRTFDTHTRSSSPWFGRTTAVAGDLDGDGDDDLLVAAPEEGSGESYGVVYAFDVATADSFRVYLPPPGDTDYFGGSLAPVGDVDGDGRPDFVAGAPYARGAGQARAGMLHVVSGATGASLLAFASENPGLNGEFGYAAAWADLDGDGAPDPIIGASRERYAPDDTTFSSGAVYVYTAASIRAAITTTAGTPGPEPSVMALGAVVPNPARGPVTLAYTLPSASDVSISVYDALGRRVAVLAEGARPAGAHAAALDAGPLAPGVYVVRLEAAGAAVSRRLVVAR